MNAVTPVEGIVINYNMDAMAKLMDALDDMDSARFHIIKSLCSIKEHNLACEGQLRLFRTNNKALKSERLAIK
jgi:hypothetical protein